MCILLPNSSLQKFMCWGYFGSMNFRCTLKGFFDLFHTKILFIVLLFLRMVEMTIQLIA